MASPWDNQNDTRTFREYLRELEPPRPARGQHRGRGETAQVQAEEAFILRGNLFQADRCPALPEREPPNRGG